MLHRPDLRANLRATYDWIERSRSPRNGGSRAYYAPVLGWSRTYPETTGYIIPTVLRTGAVLKDDGALQRARSFGEFLVDIQQPEGGWFGLTWPPKRSAGLSVFNTAQILKGLTALARATDEPVWLESASRGAGWLAGGVDGNGMWSAGGYRSETNPSYYTQVAWPMLEVWALTGERTLRDAAVRVLEAAVARRTLLGGFRGWGFGASDLAFTHTIAYTLRGFLESARLLGEWERYGKPVLPALRRLAEDAVAGRGRLPGAYSAQWEPERWYTCLTGNVQIAICLLLAARRCNDALFPTAARALIEETCRQQSLQHPIPDLRGAVAGSAPIWGRYMRGRYPNWAAKYLCDAIVALLEEPAGEASAGAPADRCPTMSG
ncbi:MAG: hypothetical protein JO359_05965 [Candidatus Eremiobacteraeota bacterium]|nr:hypothetical protein [Candidatus Eremiobacteraeota bacterium]